MPSLRYIPIQVRRARLLRPSIRFLVREVLIRRPVTRCYSLRRTHQVVTLRHRTPDLGGFAEVFLDGNYDMPQRVRECLDDIPDPLRAVDLGANIGLFGLRLLAQHPNSVITAFEPDPSNADILHRTIAANSRSEDWRVIQACAGTRDGTVLFRSGHFLESQIADDGAPTSMRDAFPLMANAHLIKIDIEGAELALISDPRFRQLAATVLWMEFHPPHSEQEIVSFVRSAGFRPGQINRRGRYGDFWATKPREHQVADPSISAPA